MAPMIANGEQTNQKGKDDLYEIRLESDKKKMPMGFNFPFKVTYINKSDQDWVLEQPDTSEWTDVKFIRLWPEPPYSNGYSFSRKYVKEIDVGGEIHTFWLHEPSPELVIPPKGQFEFSFDFKWQAYETEPSDYTFWIKQGFKENEEDAIFSNRITISYVFDESTVPALVDLMRDLKNPLYVLIWVRNWLRKFKPDFSLDLSPKHNPMFPINEEIVKANEGPIKEFLDFWEKNKDSEEIRAIIEKINAHVTNK